MAGNKKISQLTLTTSLNAVDLFVIEQGGVNFSVAFSTLSGNPGGLDLNGVVNDFIVKNEKSEVALEQRITLPAALSFVDNTAAPPTEVNGDIYLLDDTGASHVDWDGLAANTWAKYDGTASLWKGITALDGFLCTLTDTGDVRHFDPSTSAWELFGAGAAAGANTEIQFNNGGVFGASSLLTFDTGFGVFTCDAAAVFNEGGTDQNFRIEGLSEVNLFFVDAGLDQVGIATNAPTQTFTVETQSNSGIGIIEAAGGNRINMYVDTSGFVNFGFNNTSLSFWSGLTGSTTTTNHRFTFNMANSRVSWVDDSADGNFGGWKFFIQTTGANDRGIFARAGGTGTVTGGFFEAYNAGTANVGMRAKATGATANYAIVVDSGEGDVGFGTITPVEKLDVVGKIRSSVAFNLNGTDGIGAVGGTTYTFGGGGSGDIASMTFNGGILTAVTLVP